MFKLIRRSTIKVGLKEATGFLDLNHFDRQRNLDEDWCKILEEKMRDGRFLHGDIATSILKYKKIDDPERKVLMNGQHISWTIAFATPPISIVSTLAEYECETAEDASLLYRQFDGHKSRSLGDCVKVEAVALGVKWPTKIVSLVLGSGLLKDNIFHASKDEKIKYLKQYIKPGNFVNKILTNKDKVLSKESKHLLRQPVIAVMLLTFEKSISDSENFWIPIILGEDLKRDDPRLIIRNWLMRTSVGRGRGASNITAIASTKEMMAKCIHAWNAFRNGGKTGLKYYANAPLPPVR
jgi:hypothetical protein